MLITSIVLLVIFVYVTIGFIISFLLKRNDIADVMWGPGIFISCLATFFIVGGGPYLTLVLVFLWALRIFIHIGKRFLSKKEEDFRYATWRQTWKYFHTRSYLQIFLLQGFLMFLVSSSFVFLKIYNIQINPVMFLVGTFISIFALIFETVADNQLTNFLKQKTGGIMQTGLWKYSRHPNYFGEVTFWWGMFLVSIPSSSVFIVNPIFLISPITITFLILYVSGIPMLEKKYEDNLEFQVYKSKTNAFFPWFPKK
jgi:steroid 5-alpha reductase family enzyme